MPDRQNKKLATLAALAGLTQQLSAGPRQDAELAAHEQSGRVSAALQLLGLQQQQQNDAATQAFRATQQGTDQQRLGLEQQHYSDENQQHKDAVALAAFKEQMDRGGSWDDSSALLPASIQPQVRAQHQAQVDRQVPLIDDQVRAMYGTPSVMNDPKALKAALATLSLGHPDAFQQAHWDQLNSEIPTGPQQPGLLQRLFGAVGHDTNPHAQSQIQPQATPTPDAPASSFVSHPSGPNSMVFDAPGYLKQSNLFNGQPLHNAGEALRGGVLDNTALQNWLLTFGQKQN